MKDKPFRLAPAAVSDAPAIRALIHQVGINPTGLDWRRFILAVDEQNNLIGCGQLKLHPDGTLELASLAVVPEWRSQGVARRIIAYLEASATSGSIYLTCRSGLGPFYEKFGYRVLRRDEMPPHLRRIDMAARIISKLHLINDSLLVMKKEL
jgi:N-acetylglutamate synthase-like GNAT family acetyltransferase